MAADEISGPADVEVVTATRMSRERFMAEMPLGLSLERLRFDPRIKARIFAENRLGLSEVYNQAIDAPAGPDILVFIHDDVWIDDIFIVERLLASLDNFQVVGVAGNRRRYAGQTAWHAHPSNGGYDTPYLSGAIANREPFGPVSYYGAAPAFCQLLDGVFMAARRSTLQRAGIRFDQNFDFHFYDMDFCRSARRGGLSVGTWPIVITHRSGGVFNSPPWQEGRRRYLEKWGD
jgi:GT2 family glycosyltransferase